MIELLPMPGMAGWPELGVGLALALGWMLNATLAAGCPRPAAGLLAASELAALLILENSGGWRADSAMLWLWANALTSLSAGLAFQAAVRRRLGKEFRFSVASFWRLGWPLLLLIIPANLAIGAVRLWLGSM